MERASYQKICYKLFGPLAAEQVKAHPKFGKSLAQAHITIQAEEYVAYAMMNSLVVAILTSTLVIMSLRFFPVFLSLFWLVIISPVLLALAAYFGFMKIPSLRAKERAKDIDAKIAYVANFIAALSVGGKNPDVIIKEMAAQEIYGEVQKEFLWIYRDISVLGKDIITAIRDGHARCPSSKCRDFLQGIVTVVTSGGELKPYFMAKADQYMAENRLEQKSYLESLAVVAESFVTIGVGGVLFLIVTISVMAMLSSNVQGSLSMLYLIVLVMLPIVHAGFILAVKNMTREA
ncbi:MAG: type II secretion system F family protein [Thermoplasmata archaeon]